MPLDCHTTLQPTPTASQQRSLTTRQGWIIAACLVWGLLWACSPNPATAPHASPESPAPLPSMELDAASSPAAQRVQPPSEPSPPTQTQAALPKPPAPSTAPETIDEPSKGALPSTRPPLKYVELITGHADPASPLPMIVAVHGLGDSPQGFKGLFKRFKLQARVIVPQAPAPWRRGFTWFPCCAAKEPADAVAVEGMRESARTLVSLMAHLRAKHPTVGKPIITGFSQGGMMSFAVAVLYPDAISAAMPLAGLLPNALWPDANASLPPVHAFHGDQDRRVSVDADQDIVDHLKSLGVDASITRLDGRHQINGAMHSAWTQALTTHLRTLTTPPAP